MRNKRNIALLFAIVLLTALLRLYKLGENPPSLYWDEASLGYNAYSILKTGKDEHGEPFPLTRFIAFGDYKPPGYIYLTIPFIAVFDLTQVAVRLPSALAGILTVLVTYFLVKELLKGKKSRNKTYKLRASLPIISALLLAISPWHILLSRGAFEANLATFFSTSGLYFFLRGLRKPNSLLLSAISFVLAMYTFNTQRVFIPLFILVTVIIYRKKLSQIKSWVVLSGLLAFVLISPMIPFLLSREGRLRFEEVTIFRNLDPVVLANERIQRQGGNLFARLLHNRRIQFASEFFKHYADHFRADFLFFSGDINPRLGTRDHGLLYPIELFLIPAGIYFLFKKKYTNAALLLILWWLIGIIPAATARETPHALRTLNVVPVPHILAATGLVGIYQALQRNKRFAVLVSLAYIIFLSEFLHTYFIHYPVHWHQSWQYGYKQMVEKVKLLENNYQKIFITQKYGRPYINFLFYKKYPPQEYWNTRDASRDWHGLWTVKGFDKYTFGTIPQERSNPDEKWLIVTEPEAVPEQADKIDHVNAPNGEVVFEISEL